MHTRRYIIDAGHNPSTRPMLCPSGNWVSALVVHSALRRLSGLLNIRASSRGSVVEEVVVPEYDVSDFLGAWWTSPCQIDGADGDS